MEQQTLTAAKLLRPRPRGRPDGRRGVRRQRTRARRQKKNGEAFMKLQLGDVTGTVEAVIWDGVDDLLEAVRPGGVVRVVGNFSVDQRYGSSLTVRSLRAAEPGEYEPGDLDGGPIPARRPDGGRPAQPGRHDAGSAPARAARRAASPTTRRSGAAGATPRRPSTTTRPTATACSSTACRWPRASARSSATFPGIDRDVAVTGALLHDIGKIEAYASRATARSS